MLDKHQLQRLEEFKAQLVSTKVVNKEAILSVESIIGSGVITSNRNINMYTDVNTSVSVNETLDIVDELIVNTKKELTISNMDVMRMVDKTITSINNVLYRVNELKNISKEVLDKLMSDSIRYYYDDNDSLCDIHLLDIFEVMCVHNNYISKVINVDTQEGISVFNSIYDKMSEIQTEHYSEYKILPLLSTMLFGSIEDTYMCNAVDVREVTFKDFVENISNFYLNISRLENIKTNCEKDYASFRDKNYQDYKDVNTNFDTWYGKYQQFESFITHKASIDVISLLSNLAKIK